MNYITTDQVIPSRCEAFWFKGSSTYAINRTHIDYIINNSSLFNLNIEYIRSIYNKHEEPFRFEGKARNEIMESVIKNGWVRIRKRRVNRKTLESAIIQFSNSTKEEEVYNFIHWAISMRVLNNNEHILLNNIEQHSNNIVSIIDNQVIDGMIRRIND